MIKDFDHVVLTTADLDKCLDFYTRVLGMRVERYGSRGAERIAAGVAGVAMAEALDQIGATLPLDRARGVGRAGRIGRVCGIGGVRRAAHVVR